MSKFLRQIKNFKKEFEECNRHLMNSPMQHLKHWLPSGTVEGHEFVALNPTRPDYNAGSFRINIQTGRWADFATEDKGGDLISLYAYLHKCSQFKALQSLSNRAQGGHHEIK